MDWPRLVHVFTGHTRDVNAIAISPDGSLVVSASDDHTIRFWSTATGAPIGEPLQGHTNAVTAVAFSPDGMCIASGSQDNTVRLWSAKKSVAIGEALSGHEDRVTSVAFSPDGTRVVSGSDLRGHSESVLHSRMARGSLQARMTTRFNYGIHGHL